MRGRDRRVTRLLVAGLLAVSAFCVSVAPSAAAPSVSESKSELEAARAKLGELQQKFEQLVENYDYAAVQLADTTQKLDAAQTEMDRANTAAQEARDVLSQRAVTAYEGGMGSSLEVLLGAGDFTQLSDRLEFLSHMAANDADLAQQAELSEDQAHALKHAFLPQLLQVLAQGAAGDDGDAILACQFNSPFPGRLICFVPVYI